MVRQREPTPGERVADEIADIFLLDNGRLKNNTVEPAQDD